MEQTNPNIGNGKVLDHVAPVGSDSRHIQPDPKSVRKHYLAM